MRLPLITPDRVASHLFLLDERAMAGAHVLLSSLPRAIRNAAVQHHIVDDRGRSFRPLSRQ